MTREYLGSSLYIRRRKSGQEGYHFGVRTSDFDKFLLSWLTELTRQSMLGDGEEERCVFVMLVVGSP